MELLINACVRVKIPFKAMRARLSLIVEKCTEAIILWGGEKIWQIFKRCGRKVYFLFFKSKKTIFELRIKKFR